MYSASKAGIVHFMRSTAGYYADKGITVNLGECLRRLCLYVERALIKVALAVAPNLTGIETPPTQLLRTDRLILSDANFSCRFDGSSD